MTPTKKMAKDEINVPIALSAFRDKHTHTKHCIDSLCTTYTPLRVNRHTARGHRVSCALANVH